MFMTYLSHFHTPAIIRYGRQINLNLSTGAQLPSSMLNTYRSKLLYNTVQFRSGGRLCRWLWDWMCGAM